MAGANNPNAFNAAMFCTLNIQAEVGLAVPQVDVPRIGDRTAEGAMGYDRTGVFVHMQPMTTEQAIIIWDSLPAGVKTNPANSELAQALITLGSNANKRIPDGIANAVDPPHVVERGVQAMKYYMTAGGVMFTGAKDSKKFISFLWLNMDACTRVKWYDLTGREQWEWYQAWLRTDQSHLRVVNETRGLRGTDISVITTVEEIRQAMIVSPLFARSPKPNHINEDSWNTARGMVPQNLFPGP